MSCQVNHCHAYVQREKAEMGIDSSFAKTLCNEPEEIADVCLRFPVCKRQLINCLLNTWRTTDRTHKEIFFTQFCYSITVFLCFQDILPLYCRKEYSCNLDLKQALSPTSNFILFLQQESLIAPVLQFIFFIPQCA